MKPKNLMDPPKVSPKRNKYNAVKTKVDGITFDSKKEASYYRQLKMAVEEGEISYFLRQVPFDLEGNVKYRVDFMVVCNDGTIDYIDVKGHRTPVYILKKKQVEAHYPITITEA
jgi:hypothetical protein